MNEIVDYIKENNINEIRTMVLTGKCKVNETDSNGMTTLLHAAYKGKADVCKFLIEHGADVNVDTHEHRYTALHFAALSGSTETVQLLLSAGAKAYATNTIGRTAAQMAGFVGNHEVVALINSFIPQNDISYYTKCTGLEKEPKLVEEVEKPLYDLLMQVNLNPVHLTLKTSQSDILLQNLSSSAKVLQLMCEKEAKKPENVNEVLCVKLHYVSHLLATLEKELEKTEGDSKEQLQNGQCIFESLIKKWLRARVSDGFQELLDIYVRDAIKAFPFPEMPLFMQIVQSMTNRTIGETWALGVLTGCINGQRAFHDEVSCGTCGTENKNAKKCSRCHEASYCNKLCQRLHWGTHKKFCDKLAEDNKRKCERDKTCHNEDSKDVAKEEEENKKKQSASEGSEE